MNTNTPAPDDPLVVARFQVQHPNGMLWVVHAVSAIDACNHVAREEDMTRSEADSLVTVRERVDYTLRVDAENPVHATDCATAYVRDGNHPYVELATREVSDVKVLETEEV